MAQRNIDLHTLAVAAVNAREVPEDLLAPDFRIENRVSAVTDYVYRGATGWRDWMNDIFEVFAAGARYEVVELIAEDDHFVAAEFRLVGRGALSEIPLEFRWVGVTWFRNGKATRAVGYPTRQEALRAVGLHE